MSFGSVRLSVLLLTVTSLLRAEDPGNSSSVRCQDLGSLVDAESLDLFIPDLISCLENGTIGTFGHGGIPSNTNLTLGNNTSGSPDNITPVANNPTPIVEWIVIYRRFEFATRGVFLPVVLFLALIGNSVVIIVLCKGYVQSNSYVYLLGLASANLIFTILSSARFIRTYQNVKVLRSWQTFYSYYMVYVYPLSIMVQTSVVWVIVLFTFERFVAVTYPMKVQMFFSVKRSRIAVVSAFVFGIGLNFIRLFRRTIVPMVDPITGEKYFTNVFSEIGNNVTYDAIIFWSYLLATYIAPFILLVVFNSMIIRRVWQARSKRMKLSGGNDQKESNTANRESQITHLLVAIVVGFLMCNALSCVGYMHAAIYGYGTVGDTIFVWYVYVFGSVLYQTNPFLNCILYAVCNDSMRDGMKSVLCLKRTRPTDS